MSVSTVPDDNEGARPRSGLRARWDALNDWIKSLLIAFAVLGGLHAFVMRWVAISSTSMYATLYPGDLVAVAKWPVWSGFDRGDVVVFRDPMQDDRTMARRQLLIKRAVGSPGDQVELRNGELLVNDKSVPAHPTETRSWMVRLGKDMSADPLLARMGLPAQPHRADARTLELPVNIGIAEDLRKRALITGAEPMRTATGSALHLFPYSPNFRWNTDNYGPILVPRKGEEVRINIHNLAMYDRIISRYEGHRLEVVDNTLMMDGAPLDRYTFQQDYYFVLGDSRHHSADSRYWGFVPADHLVGRATGVLLSTDPATGSLRSDRWFTGIP